MAETSFDCVVVGSGPGGYVAAIRAAQLGLKTAVVERESPGGVCLNWGCIPTKALLKSAEVYQTLRHAGNFGITATEVSFDFPAVIKRSRQVVDKMTKGVQFLLKKNKVELLRGHGRVAPGNIITITDASGQQTAISYRNAIIATGARARTFPNLPVDGERIITYRQALAREQCPQRLLVVGAGAIGVEFAYFYRSFGAEVTVVEVLDQLLPIEDAEVAQTLARSLTKLGIQIRTKTTVTALSRQGDEVQAELALPDGQQETWRGDLCLVAVGVQGNCEDLGLESVGVKVERSYIQVDQSYRTNVAGIWAIGDIIGPPWLAHVASHEGILAAELIAGHKPHPLDYTAIPGCTYCQPQVASIGLTEKKARESGKKVRVGRFPFSASGKAVATNETEGFVKVVVDEELEQLLGVHIIHAEATELIGEASLAFSHEAIASSVLNTVHAHPTLSEAVMEAMGDALGRAIHI